jgi:hypothetical protein
MYSIQQRVLQYWGRSYIHQHWFAIGLRFGQKFFNVAFCSYLQHQFFNSASVPGGRFSNPPKSQSPIVVRHTMTDPITIADLIELVKEQEPERKDIIFALTDSIGGHWESKANYRFVNSKKANKIGAEWQFDENIVLEHDTLSTIVLDYLKDKRIGGIEFMKFIL